MSEKETQTTEKIGPFKTLIGIVIKPRATMEALSRAKRRWWLVPALLMVAALVVSGVTYSRANAERVYQDQLAFMESLPPEQRGPMSQPPEKINPPTLTVALNIAGKAVTIAGAWLVWAGLLALASTFFGRNGARFGGFFAMTVWAWIPYVVRNLVQGVYMGTTNEAIYNQGLSGLILDKAPQPMTLGPRSGFVAPTRGDQVLAALLGRVDVYLVWNLVLLILGVCAFARLPRKKAWLVTLGIWVVTTLLSLIPTLVGLTSGFRLF